MAQGLIHVHHLRQLADVNAKYQVDPIQDLRPVCPTCHAVIHSQTPPFTIEEISAMIAKRWRLRLASSPNLNADVSRHRMESFPDTFISGTIRGMEELSHEKDFQGQGPAGISPGAGI